MTTWDATDRPIGGRATPIAEQEEKITRTYPKWEGRILALFVLAVSLFVGYELVFRYQVVYGDAMSRALSGLYTVFRPHFHLAAIGFLWNPLPSLLAIPFALLRGFWPPLMQLGFAANIISAGFAAVGVFHLNRLAWRFGLGRWTRIAVCLLYVVNPMMLLYGGNGMTDGMECAILIACVDQMLSYLMDDNLMGIVKAGTWLAAAFMVRHETVPIGAAFALGILLTVYRRDRDWQKAIGISIAFLFPVFTAGITWIFLNWMIMHNPLYFADSHYSNAAQLSSGIYNTAAVVADRHNLTATVLNVWGFMRLFWPFPIAFAAAALSWFFQRSKSPVLPIALGSLGAPALQALLLYGHRSADWARFFIYYIPFGFMLFAFSLSLVKATARKWLALGAVVVLLSADYGTWQTLHSPVWGHGDHGVVSHIEYGTPLNRGQNAMYKIIDGRSVAAYINTHSNLRVLMSSFVSFSIIPLITNPGQIVFTNDADFKAVLLNPRGRVNAILAAPINGFTQASDAITRTYPALWSGGVPWTRLIKSFPGGDRLYAILPSAP